ncbi:MAG: sn-glycerol-3-phosphate ABC transporter ATP-binding protein UgpC [Nitratireductor sp.]|uniref:ABC transporter ATP-binding protein n=1 Tax=Nitratireductor sp. TaxID=1872084 RepID=UPI002636027A|nr:sn-glycerol-3-phosphate ABC transporter ATP-binding protein UgpC [Nitratireductor sp.]MCV0349641.1 sn-glycerol-3-phosphate ABC transporter ATP-binding protein UgpC [Nitratireductor sp.]
MAELKLTDICKRYGSLTVIEKLSLAIDDGEFVVLVGPSGCGKSTLLRMIAGLEAISAGDLMIGGARANDIPPQKRDTSMVFQSYALFPHMSVRDNISFGPRVRGEPKDETERRIKKAAEILNLGDYLDRKPGQLSGGQRQRVAMGRAIVRDPKVFLFDEPLSNLDAKLRIQMRTEIKALHQKLGTTIVYVTHDQIEAMTMADRIVVMNGGNIEQVGSPLELYDNPANTFVAGFIGSPAMSFLQARTESADGAPVAVLGDGSKLPIAAGAGDGRPVTIGIRPESYVRDPQGPLALKVAVVEPTGPEIHVFGTIAGEDVRVVLRDRDLPRPGEELRLAVPVEHVHLFDHDNGQRLKAA